MPQFAYISQSSGGVVHRGHLIASAPSEVRELLSQRGHTLVSIRTTEELPRATVSRQGQSYRMLGKIRPAERELLLQQLAVMLGSGLELVPSLRELSIHSTGRRLQELCASLARSVEQGSTFESALAESAAFPTVVTRLVRVGEQTGELAEMLRRGTEFIQKRRQARGNLLSSLAYPLLVAIAASSVAIYLVGWAIPKLATFLHSLGRKLPAMTQSLIDLTVLIREYGPTAAIVLTTVIIAAVLTYVWQPGRYWIDKYLLRMPLIGSLVRISETQQLASSLALMLRSGVFLPDALDTASALHRNRFLVERIVRCREQLSMGNDLASGLSGSEFGSMFSSMIRVGERTGELPQALEHVASFYAAQLDARLERLSKMIEPAIIVVVGGLVAYVYIAFFMALLSAGGKFN